MRRLPFAQLALSLVLTTGCGLLGDDDEDDAPPPPDPALAPPAPAPVEPREARPRTGSFTIPGLEGVSIPLPAPRGEYREPESPARGTLAAAPPGTWDGNGHMTRSFIESRSESIHQALVAALDARENQQVRDIPLRVVIQHEQPNAAAGCRGGTPLMMITSAMLELCAGIAEAKAYDELAGTDTYETYVTSVVQQVRQGQRIQGVDPSAHRAPQATDAHKLARQVHLFDQQVAFILGHELAHHYRGHTNCVGGRSDAEVRRDEMARILAHTVPPFEQPREVEADMWGLVSVLEAGRTRSGGTWTEEGGLLNLDFFRRVSDRGGAELVLAFLSTHPPSAIRIPIVRSTAQQWEPGWRPPRMPVPGEAGQGPGVDVPTPAGNLRLPDPAQLPIDPSQLPIPFPLGGGAGGGGQGGD